MPKDGAMPAHVVVLRVDGFYYSPAAWPTKQLGRPTDEALARYVEGFERSTEPGGTNAHLGSTTIVSALVRRQRDREIVARYKQAPAPMFVAVGDFLY